MRWQRYAPPCIRPRLVQNHLAKAVASAFYFFGSGLTGGGLTLLPPVGGPSKELRGPMYPFIGAERPPGNRPPTPGIGNPPGKGRLIVNSCSALAAASRWNRPLVEGVDARPRAQAWVDIHLGQMLGGSCGCRSFVFGRRGLDAAAARRRRGLLGGGALIATQKLGGRIRRHVALLEHVAQRWRGNFTIGHVSFPLKSSTVRMSLPQSRMLFGAAGRVQVPSFTSQTSSMRMSRSSRLDEANDPPP